MSLGSLTRYDDAEDEIRDEDHNLLIIPPQLLQQTLELHEADIISQPPVKPSPPPVERGSKANILVPYEGGNSDDDDDASSLDSGEEEGEEKHKTLATKSKTKPAVVNLGLFDGTSVLSSVEIEAAKTSDTFENSPRDSNESINLPPEPVGRCSKALQEKIAKMIAKKKSGHMNVNEYVQRKKEFRNPSIYDKLVTFIGIDEHGTNFPKKLYDPSIWGPESYYDALAKTQKEFHKEKEKEKIKKTHVDFVTGTKKVATLQVPPAASVIDKKSKWDQKVPPPPKVTSVAPKVPPTVQAAIKSNSKI